MKKNIARLILLILFVVWTYSSIDGTAYIVQHWHDQLTLIGLFYCVQFIVNIILTFLGIVLCLEKLIKMAFSK